MGQNPNEDDLEGYLENMFAGFTKDELAKPIHTMEVCFPINNSSPISPLPLPFRMGL